MGGFVSRDGEAGSEHGWNICTRLRNSLLRGGSGTTGRDSSRESYIEQIDVLHATPWKVVWEGTLERWRKSAVVKKCAPFPVCSKKVAANQSQKWYSKSCHDARQDTLSSSISYQLHNSARKLLFYKENEPLTKLLGESQLEKIVPSKGEFISLYFITTHEGQRTGVILLHNSEKNELMYFFIEKSTPYKPRGLAVCPDGTTVCLLLADDPANDFYVIQVYSKRPAAFNDNFYGCSFELECEIPDLKADVGCPKIIFDPRYYSSRLGMVNVTAVQNVRVTHYFLVYDLKAKKAVIMPHENYISDSADDLLDAGYSPDGAWVHAVVGHPSIDVAGKYMRSIWIMNSDTLEIVRSIDIGSDNIDECPVNFMPTYSFCSRKMALRQRKCVKVYQLPVPDTLRSLCRSVIRQTGMQVSRMTIPDAILNYIQFKPYL